MINSIILVSVVDLGWKLGDTITIDDKSIFCEKQKFKLSRIEIEIEKDYKYSLCRIPRKINISLKDE